MDRLAPEMRSRVMARIRATETGPERLLRHHLRRVGLRGWRKNLRLVPGVSSADVAFTRWRIAVFVDGAFWHGHPRHFTRGKSGAYWDDKIARNRARDRRTTRVLRRAGWNVIRAWDFDVEHRPERVVQRVAAAVAAARAREPHA